MEQHNVTAFIMNPEYCSCDEIEQAADYQDVAYIKL
jgi:hypothetical protein